MDIINQIINDGKQVKLTQEQFSKIISDYYQKNYNINGIFDFLPIIYEYVDEHYVYNYVLQKDVATSNKIKVHASLPCIVDKNAYEYYKRRNIVIPTTIRLDDLETEIKRVLPDEIVRVPNAEIARIFNELGLSHPLYSWNHNTQTNEAEYTVIVRPLNIENKTKVLEY